jgi:hypothetical protein
MFRIIDNIFEDINYQFRLSPDVILVLSLSAFIPRLCKTKLYNKIDNNIKLKYDMI